jgi:hypothetical protein
MGWESRDREFARLRLRLRIQSRLAYDSVFYLVRGFPTSGYCISGAGTLPTMLPLAVFSTIRSEDWSARGTLDQTLDLSQRALVQFQRAQRFVNDMLFCSRARELCQSMQRKQEESIFEPSIMSAGNSKSSGEMTASLMHLRLRSP